MNLSANVPIESTPTYGPERSWVAELRLGYIQSGGRTRISQMEFKGPLRVQRPFYPEGSRCHTYLLHPPGGMVSGDSIHIDVDVADKSQVFITTPSAGKLYGADTSNVVQKQSILLTLSENAELEFLPQENILFDGANGRLKTDIDLAVSSRLITWDIVSFGRPYGGYQFENGSLVQELAVRIDGRLVLHEGFETDPALRILSSPVGLNSNIHMATMLIISPAQSKLYDDWVGILRASVPESSDVQIAVTQRDQVILVRALANEIEPLRNAFINLWKTVRPHVLNAPSIMPRIWLT